MTIGLITGLAGCGGETRDDAPANSSTSGGGEIDTGGEVSEDGDASTEEEETSQEPKLDTPAADPTIPSGCGGDEDCELIDVLFVIDNSGTMGEEQLNLARNFPRLVERLQNLEDGNGLPINANVNIGITTSDFDHPLCAPFQDQGYEPAQGDLVFDGCNARLDSFESIDPSNPVSIPEACTEQCPMDVSPGGAPFIHFDAIGTNVPYNDVAGALSCVAPQGINGCGYEAPLESMLHALRPDKCWNNPGSEGCDVASNPEWGWVGDTFIRDGSTLAIAIITDEADCSVQSPDGYGFFTNDDTRDYWSEDPRTGLRAQSSAICWDGGVECDDEDGDGIYESCTSAEKGVLHPTSRYIEFLDYLKAERGVEIVMLGVLGVPPVTERMDVPPFAPTAGGVEALVYRDWQDGEYNGSDKGGDILPEEWAEGTRAENKQFEFGIGPGCTAVSDESGFSSQAMPPVRIREVCESLNVSDGGEERIRCCIESICDDDFSPAIDCLTGIIGEVISPVG